jgi:hypothetical protein
LDTVAVLTPARSAICLIVTIASSNLFHLPAMFSTGRGRTALPADIKSLQQFTQDVKYVCILFCVSCKIIE